MPEFKRYWYNSLIIHYFDNLVYVHRVSIEFFLKINTVLRIFYHLQYYSSNDSFGRGAVKSVNTQLRNQFVSNTGPSLPAMQFTFIYMLVRDTATNKSVICHLMSKNLYYARHTLGMAKWDFTDQGSSKIWFFWALVYEVTVLWAIWKRLSNKYSISRTENRKVKLDGTRWLYNLQQKYFWKIHF